ncbi:MAG: lipoprotein [Myxococcota bacterium]
MKRILATLSLLAALAGCQNGTTEAELVAGLRSFDLPAPEFTVAESVWRDLPPSCDDVAVTGDDLGIAYAENEPELGVLLHQGTPVCVDTWVGLELELELAFGDPSPDPMRPLSEFLRELPERPNDPRE